MMSYGKATLILYEPHTEIKFLRISEWLAAKREDIFNVISHIRKRNRLMLTLHGQRFSGSLGLADLQAAFNVDDYKMRNS